MENDRTGNGRKLPFHMKKKEDINKYRPIRKLLTEHIKKGWKEKRIHIKFKANSHSPIYNVSNGNIFE